jgi:hypothetical protein
MIFKYECHFRNAAGERAEVIVELEPHEIEDAMRHLKLRGANGPGGPDGPIAFGYALRHVSNAVPPGFSAADLVVNETRRCILH